MKLIGNNRNNKHSSGHHAAPRAQAKAPKTAEPKAAAANAPKAGGKGMKKGLRKAIIVAAAVVVVILGVVIGYSMWEAPPDITPPSAAATPTATPTSTPTATPTPSESVEPTEEPEVTEEPSPSLEPELDAEPLTTARSDDVYTFMLVGRDKGSNSTDTIVVGKFDTKNHTIDMVNIPRDTLVNIGWNGTPKKLNAIYPGYINSGKSGVDGLREQIKNLLGFDVDFYAIVNIDMVIQVIDAIGGVDFDVPIDMHYDDSYQGFSVHLKKGYQHLNGTQAMGVFRFRQGGWYQGVKYSGYPRGDLQRIETQQALLLALAGQMLDLGNIPNLKTIIDICVNNVETTLTASNMAFFARQFLKCSKDDIQFHSVDIGSSTAINGISFVSLPINGWLEIVNEHLSPYKDPITRANVNMISTTNGYTIESTLGYVAGGFDSFFCTMCTAKHGTTKYHTAGLCPPDEPEESATPSPEVSTSPSPEVSTTPEGGSTTPDVSTTPEVITTPTPEGAGGGDGGAGAGAGGGDGGAGGGDGGAGAGAGSGDGGAGAGAGSGDGGAGAGAGAGGGDGGAGAGAGAGGGDGGAGAGAGAGGGDGGGTTPELTDPVS